MATYKHTYRCRCGDWTSNRIEVYTTSAQKPFDREKHNTLKEGVGLNPECWNYLTWIRSTPYTNAIPKSSLISKKISKQRELATPSSDIAGVKLGPDLDDHVFKGEINGSTATGYHCLACTTYTDPAPYTISGTTHKLAALTRISRSDDYGVYWVGIKMAYVDKGVAKVTPWKISVMFPARLSASTITVMIKVAFYNQTETAENKAVDWNGRADNGLKIGGRSDNTGIISAFPAYRDSFKIPDDVSRKFAAL
jgi:hypothetical protein